MGETRGIFDGIFDRHIGLMEFRVLFLYFVIFLSIFMISQSSMKVFLWDFQMYYFAGKAYALGLDPYDNGVISRLAGQEINLPYNYPPPTLVIFRLFSMMDYEKARAVYTLLKIAVFSSLVYMWGSYFLKRRLEMSFFVVCGLGYNLTFLNDAMSGNLNAFEQAFLWLGFYFLLERKVPHFCLCTVCASLSRFTPLAFLALPLLAGNGKNRLYVGLSVFAFAAYIAFAYMMSPILFWGYAKNLQLWYGYGGEGGTNAPCLIKFAENVMGAVGLKLDFWGLNILPYMLYALAVSIILFLSWRAYRIIRAKGDLTLLVFYACTVYALVHPRFKDYHYILLLLPTYFILKESFTGWRYPLALALTLALVPGFLSGPDYMYGLLGYYPMYAAYAVWAMYLVYIFRLKEP
jgi:hypothetical protein